MQNGIPAERSKTEHARKTVAGLGTIFRLQQRALATLQIAIDELTQIASSVYGRNRALLTVQRVYATLEAIDLGYYLMQKKMVRRPPVESFDKPIQECLTLLNSKSPANLPFDVNCIRRSLETRPDYESLGHLDALIPPLRRSYRDIRLLQSRLLRFLMSGWTVAGIFVIAALYAIGYFAFVKSGVNHPMSHDGAWQIVASAQAHVDAIAAALKASGNAFDASIAAVLKLVDLISTVPLLIAAVGVIYPLVRKVFMISNIRA